MFTQPCFIRKNTPELRKKLENLGYKICLCCEFDGAFILNNLISNGTIHGFGYYSEDSCYRSREEMIKDFENTKILNNSIDCGDNEELFLAVSALRDDTDKNQWFVLDEYMGSVNYPDSIIPKGSLLKWLSDERNNNEYMHKATIEELVKYFRNI